MSLEKATGYNPNLISQSGGCVKLSLTDSNSTQLASHPCRKMFIAAANADDVIFSIGEAVSTDNYAYLPQLAKADGTVAGEGYLKLDVVNTNKIHVKGENGDIVYYFWLI